MLDLLDGFRVPRDSLQLAFTFLISWSSCTGKSWRSVAFYWSTQVALNRFHKSLAQLTMSCILLDYVALTGSTGWDIISSDVRYTVKHVNIMQAAAGRPGVSLWKCDKMASELPESAYSDWTIGTRVMERWTYLRSYLRSQERFDERIYLRSRECLHERL